MTKHQRVLNLLALGDISIDEMGHVWRHGQRTRNTFWAYAKPRRIDYKDTVGYRVCKLSVGENGKRVTVSAHVIQWVKHNGPIPNGLEVNHIDVDKENNRLSNLELLTHSENLRHAYMVKGNWSCAADASAATELTWDDVRYIRAALKNGTENQAKLASRFNVTQASISLIASRKRWKVDPLELTEARP